jgi:hypothetical protein
MSRESLLKRNSRLRQAVLFWLALAVGLALVIPVQAAVDPSGEKLVKTCMTVAGVQFCAEHPAGNPPVLEQQSWCHYLTLGGSLYRFCWNKPPEEELPKGVDVVWRCFAAGGSRYCDF